MKTALALAALALTAASCSTNLGNCLTAEGSPERRTVELTGDYSELVNDASLDVDIRHGDVASLTIVAAPNLQDAILVRQSGEAITIDTKSGCYRNTNWRAELVTPGLASVYNDGSGGVTATDLHGRDGRLRLHADGSGSIQLKGTSNVSDLEAEAGGSGGVRLRNLPALASLTVTTDGSGGINVDGATDVEQLTVRLGGSGSANLTDVNARQVDVETDGSGSASVTAVDAITARSNGSGSIRYRGQPSTVKVDENGSGSIVARD